MNKKGFTLIELLAIIVILAVIALISTPIITNTIANVRKNADKQSATNYIDTVETKLTEAALEYPNIIYAATMEAGTSADNKDPEDFRSWGCTNCNSSTNVINIDFSGTAPEKVSLKYDSATGKITGMLKYVNGCWKINEETNNLDEITTSSGSEDKTWCGIS